nr:hypothetical protein FFPRI1PSEUD_43520 [Pseudomonas sp. FFPRI_1]
MRPVALAFLPYKGAEVARNTLGVLNAGHFKVLAEALRVQVGNTSVPGPDDHAGLQSSRKMAVRGRGHWEAVLTKTQHHTASFVMVGLGWKRYSRAISNPTDARHKDAFDD